MRMTFGPGESQVVHGMHMLGYAHLLRLPCWLSAPASSYRTGTSSVGNRYRAEVPAAGLPCPAGRLHSNGKAPLLPPALLT